MHSSVLSIDRSLAITRSSAISTFAWVGGFALLTAVGAQIVIPAAPVPFTLQTLFVLLSGALLGARKGAAAQAAYLVMGAAGLPVFAGFTGTPMHLLGPTGGYLLAFPIAAYMTGLLLHQSPIAHLPRFAAAAISMSVAMIVVFALGIMQLNMLYIHDWRASIAAGFTAMQVWDAVKIAAAAGIATELGRRLRG